MTSTSNSWPIDRRILWPDLATAKARAEKWVMLTSYDALSAPIFEQAGVRALLVGDSASMVVFGHETTLKVTLDELIPLAGAVVRSTKSALIIGDLPFGSYHESPAQALRSASRLMKEAGVGAVKVEGGRAVLPQIEALVNAGIPVMGHLGLTPQSVHTLGGFKVQGKGAAREKLLEDAKALEAVGAFGMVLEAIPESLARQVSQEIAIPTVGIGAGLETDAQVMVWQDLMGLTSGHQQKFVKQYAEMAKIMAEATKQFVADVSSGRFPDEAHTYH